jgi:hypothetical protein
MAQISREIKNIFPNLSNHTVDDELGCQVQPAGRFCLAIFDISEKEISLYPKSPVKECDSCPILSELF